MAFANLRVMGIVALVGITSVWASDNSTTAKDVFGDAGLRILAKPDRVEFYQLLGVEDFQDAQRATTLPAMGKIENYWIASRAADLSANLTRRFGEALIDRRTYDAIPSACMFNPHAALRYFRDGKSMNVLICLQCHDIMIIVYDEKGKQIHGDCRPFNESVAGFEKLIAEAEKAKK
jgi:hypothetical protein